MRIRDEMQNERKQRGDGGNAHAHLEAFYVGSNAPRKIIASDISRAFRYRPRVSPFVSAGSSARIRASSSSNIVAIEAGVYGPG